MRSTPLLLIALLPALTIDPAASAAPTGDPFADEIIAYRQGDNPVPGFTIPESALGEPERFSGEGIDPGIVSVFQPAWRPDEVVSIGAGGELIVRFDEPVEDDPDNPFGIDLLIFGNAFFVDAGGGSCGVPCGLISEPGIIEVSDDGVIWHKVPNLTPDGLFPTQGWLDVDDPYGGTPGRVPTDFTRPVDPTIDLSSFDGLTYAEVLTLYDGSGGGVGVDLAPLGLTAVSYVRITNEAGMLSTPEVDAFVDVAPVVLGDIDRDGDVDIHDLLALLSAWGPDAMGNPADIDDDGDVDVNDLLILLSGWSA